MTYEELKAEIRDLGFEENATIEELEYQQIIANSVNRAIDEINMTVRPLVKCLIVDIEETEEGTIVPAGIDLGQVEDFVDFYGKPKMKFGQKTVSYNGFTVVKDKMFFDIEPMFPLNIYYKAQPTRITVDTPNDFEIELDKMVQPLISLLASFYIWLDDDVQKAAMYQNKYDDMKNAILQNMGTPLTVSFNGGF